MPSVAVIGSGIAGLSVAIRLAVKGYKITVFEKHSGPGGKLSVIRNREYVFDAGPSLFTQPSNIEELFTLAGKNIDAYFKYRKLDLACRYFYEQGKQVDAFTDAHAFAAEMAAALGENPEAVRAYLVQSAKVYNQVGSIFLNHSLHRADTWLHPRTIRALRAVSFGHLFSTLDAFNRLRFRTPEAVQLFNRFATYNGSDPYQAPGMLSLIPHLEHNLGTYYPEGGMYSIVEALYQLALDLGVEFHFNQRVEKILVDRDQVKGVQVAEERLAFDKLISNVDVYFVYRNLLDDPGRASLVLKRERSSSALIFYWGIGRSFPGLQLHNIFFSADYAAEFRHLFKLKKLYEDPTIYINITSKMEAGMAPEGKENWFVMVNAPAWTGSFPDALRKEVRRNILQKLHRMMGTDIEPLIETEDLLTPEGIEKQTDAYMGSLYGTSSNSRYSAFLRHPNRVPHLHGMYFTGGSVHPGGGIPLCMKSACIVADMFPDL